MLMWTCGRRSMHRSSGVVMHTPNVVDWCLCVVCVCVHVLWPISLYTQTLYTYPDSFRAYKVLIAAQYSGAGLKVASEPPEFELGKTNRTTEFLAKFPLGKVCPAIASTLSLSASF